ncbi:LOW QUALITY PROTEIN: growth-regulating factor 9-like [Juglans microcarpa x Juglans regia]|uniref:LOW QUALITY PROTEIN: growth-regulating factor 9-like n=1 Tax=Juglans microcarpa x Juglans regia TaxID=2249226 RepID=UPI001B7EB38E|nr:LOW QUALITY PROTEIN: growth-regulating factor 9-like [Juglans microcarpa x Juglans regia]
MEALPFQCVPSSHSGRGGGGGGAGPQRMIDEEESTVEVEEKRKCRAVKEAQPPWIKLGLGIGSNSATAASAQNPVTEHGKPVVLTPAQLHELQGQSFIYKHLEAGLPVPLHLLVPIWKSVASCFGPSIYKLYPSFIGYFSPQGFDYRTMMDPEPGRCRRTDGKKWRCGKDVVPDQKYCERHMHRGRQRSRKPVEAIEISSPDSVPSGSGWSNDKLGESNPNHATSATIGLQLMTQSSHDLTTITHSSITGSKKYASCDAITTRTPSLPLLTMTSIPATVAMGTTTTLATVSTFTANVNQKIEHISESKDRSGNDAVYNTTMKSKSNRVISPGLGFSPKSVLQVQTCNSQCFGVQNGIELEPGRCRRTDGKKWRCSRDVVPDRKYCVQHMHRGAKMRLAASQAIYVPATSSSTSQRASPSLRINIPKKAKFPSPNTDLSISIQASPQPMLDEKSASISSSDTTTTDTSITANEYGYVSA